MTTKPKFPPNQLFSEGAIKMTTTQVESQNQESCPSFPLKEHLPETCTVRSGLILKLIPLLEDSLGNTYDLLYQHDASLGRTIRKNKEWAETLEGEIKDLTDCISELKLLGVSKPTHYS